MFKFLSRLHYYILSKKHVGDMYGYLHRQYVKLKKKWEYVKFIVLKQRSRLNDDNINSRLRALGINPDDSRSLPLSALIHITFHFDKGRLVYLAEVVKQMNRLAFQRKTIIVDTNNEELARYVERLNLQCEVSVAQRLSHPFRLTWSHRDNMAKESKNYDIFIYVEDDIYIPNSTIYRWIEEKERLKQHGFIPGFVRIETDRRHELVTSDYEYQLSSENVVEVDGRRYLATPFPYQACWIYDAETMQEFVNSYSFTNGYTGYEKHNWIRENAAIGLAYESPPAGYPSRHLIALDDTGKISPETYIFHLPCNYAVNRVPHPAGLGTVKVDAIV